MSTRLRTGRRGRDVTVETNGTVGRATTLICNLHCRPPRRVFSSIGNAAAWVIDNDLGPPPMNGGDDAHGTPWCWRAGRTILFAVLPRYLNHLKSNSAGA